MRYETIVPGGRGAPRAHTLSALFRPLLFVVAMLLLPGAALAQSSTLSGTVTDGDSGDPLPGANVFVVEIGSGAATDIDGLYTITGISAGSYTVRVTFIGFKSNEQAYSVSAGQTRWTWCWRPTTRASKKSS